MSVTKYAGFWGNSIIQTNSSFNTISPAYDGWNFRFSWDSYETSPGVFNDAYVNDQVKLAVDRGWYFGLLMFVGPNTPGWLYTSPYNVSKVYTTKSGVSWYPDYLGKGNNNNYEIRRQLMIAHLKAQIAGWDISWQNLCLYFQSTEGSTGDEGPYKGDVLDTTFTIDTTYGGEWDIYKRGVWTSEYNNFSGLQLLVNQGNDLGNLSYVLASLTNAFMKSGNFSHTYSFGGEKDYATSLQALQGDFESANRVRGECEGTYLLSWFQAALQQNTWCIATSALHAGMDFLNVAPNVGVTIAGSDFTVWNFFSKYAGLRTATNIGFCKLRDMLDVADTTRFDTGTYGVLITPSLLSEYTTKYNNIAGSGQPSQLISSRLTALLFGTGTNGQPYINAARITAIRAAFTTASYHALSNDNDQDAYNQEFGVNLIPDNYYHFVTQYSPNTTSVGKWRVGATNQPYGRYVRAFDHANSKTEMFFGIPSLAGNHNYQVKVTVVYYDNGGGQWALTYYNGSTTSQTATVTNQANGGWNSVTFNITDFQGGSHLAHSTDFTLKYIGVADTSFDVLEVEVVGQNADLPPVANAGSDQTVTYPVSSVTVNGSASTAGTGSITAYLWEQVFGASTATIATPTAVSTVISGLIVGAYQFRLTVTNTAALTNSVLVNIIVKAVNLPPIANAGSDQVIVQPQFATNLDATQSSDPNGLSLTYSWKYLRQTGKPLKNKIFTPLQSTSLLYLNDIGVYIFQVTVTNGAGLTSTDTVQITVQKKT